MSTEVVLLLVLAGALLCLHARHHAKHLHKLSNLIFMTCVSHNHVIIREPESQRLSDLSTQRHRQP